jgi:hypothetical protein
LNGKIIHPKTKTGSSGFEIVELGDGDYSLKIYRDRAGKVVVK